MKKFEHLVLTALCLAGMVSCGLDSLSPDDRTMVYDSELGHGMMVLGKKLDDPYSVSNVTKALASLYPTKAESVSVSTTDVYVRFLPSCQEEYDKLDSLGVQMIDHPVNYEIIREGDYYHDPSVPEGDITWQYAVVSPDFIFPRGIRYEILYPCHITEHEVVTRSDPDGIDWDAVERESFRLTGNAAMLSDRSLTKASAAKPEGRVTVVDSRRPDEVEGVKGVRVSCNVFVKIGQAYTDENGYYSIDKSFSSNPRYWLVFKNKKGFGIGLNLILVGGSVSNMGKHEPSGCDMEVRQEDDRTVFTRCVVNNAIWDYFEKCANDKVSMKAPPTNVRVWIFSRLSSSSTLMMQHGAVIEGTKISEYLGDYAFVVKWFLPDITLGTAHCNDYASIYSSTVHELAHATHYQQVGKGFWNKLIEFIITSFITSGMEAYGTGGEEEAGLCEVSEMWAYYVETMMYRERYPESEAVFGTSWWFFPQIFMYLDDRGLNRFMISKAMEEDVTDRESLCEKLKSLYPEFQTNIAMAFNRYYR